jgi:hypothetical protein
MPSIEEVGHSTFASGPKVELMRLRSKFYVWILQVLIKSVFYKADNQHAATKLAHLKEAVLSASM